MLFSWSLFSSFLLLQHINEKSTYEFITLLSVLTESTFHFNLFAFIVSGQGHTNVISCCAWSNITIRKNWADSTKISIVFLLLFNVFFNTNVKILVSVIKYYNNKELNEPHKNIKFFIAYEYCFCYLLLSLILDIVT